TAKLVFRGSQPRGVKVTVDDDPVPASDYKRIELDPGKHAIDVTAPHHKPFHVDLDVDDSGSRTVKVALVATEDEPDEPAPAPNDKPKLALYLAAGGGGALLASLGVALYAREEYNLCVSNGVPLPKCRNGQDGVTAANHYVNLARWVATPLAVVGAGL